jgi:hypothetical protein
MRAAPEARPQREGSHDASVRRSRAPPSDLSTTDGNLMGDHGEDDDTGLDEAEASGLFEPGSDGLVIAFERAKDRALSPAGDETARERTEWVLEATSYVVALEVIGRVGSIVRADRDALAGRARRTLLSLGGLVSEGDEDDRDALDLAARYAREGLRALGSQVADSRPGDAPPPPMRDLVRLVRGELDGFASADVALRVRGSVRATVELARMVPSVATPAASRFRLAADSLSVDAPAVALRDPRDGRAIGSQSLDEGALEAFVFPDGVIAIYADPPLPLRVTAVGVTGASMEQRASSPGYVEVGTREVSPIVLRVEYGDRSFEWALPLS